MYGTKRMLFPVFGISKLGNFKQSSYSHACKTCKKIRSDWPPKPNLTIKHEKMDRLFIQLNYNTHKSVYSQKAQQKLYNY